MAVQDHGNWANISPALYIQDAWHVSSKLTINLGLRWDGIPHTYEQSNRQSNFYPNLYNQANAAIFLPAVVVTPYRPTAPVSAEALMQFLRQRVPSST